jgi:hypothetical protein
MFARRSVGSGRAGTAGIMCTPGQVWLACRAVAVPGRRCAAGLGIDADVGGAKVGRCSVAVTLSGGLICVRAAERVSGVPAAAGPARIGQLHHVRPGGLIAMLDAGGRARYDFRSAARLLEPSARLWGEGSGRADDGGRPGMPAGMAGAGPWPGRGLLAGRPGLHGAAAGQP